MYEFAHGSTTPTAIISIVVPIGLAVSANNHFFVAYAAGSAPKQAHVEEFLPGKTVGRDLGIALKSSGGLAIDAAGDLLVGDQGTKTIDVFKMGSTQPFRRIVTAPAYPYQFAFDRSGANLYVVAGEPIGIGVFVFDYATGKPRGTITQGFSSQDYTTGVALAPAAPM